MLDRIREIAREAHMSSGNDFDAFETQFAQVSELRPGTPEYHRDFQIAFTLRQYWIDHSIPQPSEIAVDGEPFFVQGTSQSES